MDRIKPAAVVTMVVAVSLGAILGVLALIEGRSNSDSLTRLSGELSEVRDALNDIKRLSEDSQHLGPEYEPSNLWIMERRIRDIEGELEPLLSAGAVIHLVDSRDKIAKPKEIKKWTPTPQEVAEDKKARDIVRRVFIPKSWLPVQSDVLEGRTPEDKSILDEIERYSNQRFPELQELLPDNTEQRGPIDFALTKGTKQRIFVRGSSFKANRSASQATGK